LLLDPEIRLLTLTGPGGVGKTRLALQVALDLAGSFADGVWFVGLAQITDPALVAPAIAQVFGLGEGDDRTLKERLVRRLTGQSALLLLDNMEQVIEAAPLVQDLLVAAPAVKVLVTSRIPLRIEGEQEVPVPALSLPETDRLLPLRDLARNPAVALFLQRARSVDPRVELTAENAGAVAALCARLDGLPLAIELAAAQSKLLPPRTMLAQLTVNRSLPVHERANRPVRQRTMHDAIAWSYNLLSTAEQEAFRRLAVFTGGFTFEAAASVLDQVETLAASPAVLGVIGSLLDKSLIHRTGDPDDEPRFDMLQTVRDFALARLEESGEGPEMYDRHAAWVVRFATLPPSSSQGRKPRTRERALGGEIDNIRTAFATLDRRGEYGVMLRLAVALESLWSSLSYEREGYHWLTRALQTADAHAGSLVYRGMLLAARLSVVLGNYPTAMKLAESGRALATAANDAICIADALCLLGNTARGQGDQDDALQRYEDALSRYRALGQQERIAYTLIQRAKLGDLGSVDHPGDPIAQRASQLLCDEAEALYRSIGDDGGVARAMHQRSHIAYLSRDYPLAARVAGDALAMRWEQRNLTEAASSFEDLADLAGVTGAPVTAARLYGVAEALRETRGVPMWPAYRAAYEREVERTRVALTPEQFAASWAAGRVLPLKTAVAEALAFSQTLARDAEPRRRGDVAKELAHPLLERLTPRERDVLRLLAEGKSNREIAGALFISVATVKGHVTSLMTKLGLDSRTAIAAYAHRHRLV
jgi:non-specific serine/threonine protein kinase